MTKSNVQFTQDFDLFRVQFRHASLYNTPSQELKHI